MNCLKKFNPLKKLIANSIVEDRWLKVESQANFVDDEFAP